MSRCWSVFFALLLAAGSAMPQAQSYPPDYPVSDPSNVQQNPSDPCADTSAGTSEACAQRIQQGDSYERQQQRQQQRDSLELQDRRPSRAGASEGMNLNYPATAGKSQQRTLQLPPDPPTEFQRFVAASAAQLLPIYGANLFRDVPSTFYPNDL